MKKTLIGLAILSLASSALAVNQADLDARIQLLTSKFTAMQERPDRSIPKDLLRRAQGIVLMDLTKAGLVFAYQGGHGVALVRTGNGTWSAPSFVSLNEGSFGFQGGGERDFVVVLFMDNNSAQEIAWPASEYGSGARGTAGYDSAGVADQMESRQPNVLFYTDHAGLYAGAYLKGGGVTPDDKANTIYYHQGLTAYDILSGNKVSPTPAGARIAEEISDFSRQPAAPQTMPSSTEETNRTVMVPRGE